MSSHITPSYIQLSNISQSFTLNNAKIILFEQLNLTIRQGQSYAIMGPSGAGKSSLLMLMSGLEQPSSGQGSYFKNDVQGQEEFSLDFLRADIGFIFQQFHLLPELTALNNVALPLKLRGDKEAINKAKLMLTKVGLQDRMNHNPNELSGGEQQRVAIARALVFEPRFIFADEPTGNLDENSAADIANILLSCCKDSNAALIMVTHSQVLANKAEHVYNLSHDGLTQLKNAQGDALKVEVAC
ncbi:ABC transporter ATP-binding protein [Colwellia psychrerythraea]|uniref:Phosphonate-transporting ATPase n=1 Tax=Colwellia psychrerythraea TaxID=28229 RepID=A0A099L4L4_COLPS|nr:ABC transporter ATP-binding protein [Colwellia psychrerythraea]KGJ97385.1 Phosphonate-transporting ATPase [Colwellia psychrerythraea]